MSLEFNTRGSTCSGKKVTNCCKRSFRHLGSWKRFDQMLCFRVKGMALFVHFCVQYVFLYIQILILSDDEFSGWHNININWRDLSVTTSFLGCASNSTASGVIPHTSPCFRVPDTFGYKADIIMTSFPKHSQPQVSKCWCSRLLTLLI